MKFSGLSGIVDKFSQYNGIWVLFSYLIGDRCLKSIQAMIEIIGNFRTHQIFLPYVKFTDNMHFELQIIYISSKLVVGRFLMPQTFTAVTYIYTDRGLEQSRSILGIEDRHDKAEMFT